MNGHNEMFDGKMDGEIGGREIERERKKMECFIVFLTNSNPFFIKYTKTRKLYCSRRHCTQRVQR